MLSAMSAWQHNNDVEITPRLVIVVAIVAVLAIVVGLAAGTFIGRSAAPDLTTLAAQSRLNARELVRTLAPIRAEYATGVTAGKVTDAAAYAAASARLTRVANHLKQADISLSALAPGAYGRAIVKIGALAAALARPVQVAEFERLLAAAMAELAVLAGD